MTRIDDYRTRYRNARLERRDGVLEVTLHDGDGGALKWSESAHAELPLLFRDIARDVENRVVLLTGAGGHFIDMGAEGHFQFDSTVPSAGADRIYREGNELLRALLDINVPIVAAVAGNVFPHAELALLSDSIVAAENAVVKDFHFAYGIVPGDGVHIVWTMLLGANRGRHYLLSGKEFTAREALEWGVFSEVTPVGRELDRARELAAEYARQPPLVLRYTREVITLEIKRRIEAELAVGLALEGLASGYGNWR